MTVEKRRKNLDSDEALARLREGNKRSMDGRNAFPRSGPERRQELVGGQTPFAIILACADSRVSPEIVFDQGLGDLFVVRIAGNICGDTVLGSIEYAVAHLGVNLVVVMGHQFCGAVGATVDNLDLDGPATHSNIDSLIDAIRPAIKKVPNLDKSELLQTSIEENARMVAAQIRESQPIMKALRAENVAVLPACYLLENGSVCWL